jgi:DNA (cytosine-5)-methyltransferase 1
VNGTYVSLFSGIGGLDLAVEAVTGFRCLAQVERDPACLAVLERHWPSIPRWDDVRSFRANPYGRGLAEQQEPHRATALRPAPRRRDVVGPGEVDLVCGGSPCQPVSTAGKRRGTDDERWLWPEFARVIGELRPRYALVENVPGLLTVNGGRAFSEVVGDLAALGYDAVWCCLRASDVGAPHRRERLFLLAVDATWGQGAPDAEREPSELRRGPRELARAGESPSRAGHQRKRSGDATRRGASVAADPACDGRAGSGSPWRRRSGPQDIDLGPYMAAVRQWEAMMGPAPAPLDERRRLSPRFVEWMMGFPSGWTDGLSRTQALGALGNAVVPQQGAAALRILRAGVVA